MFNSLSPPAISGAFPYQPSTPLISASDMPRVSTTHTPAAARIPAKAGTFFSSNSAVPLSSSSEDSAPSDLHDGQHTVQEVRSSAFAGGVGEAASIMEKPNLSSINNSSGQPNAMGPSTEKPVAGRGSSSSCAAVPLSGGVSAGTGSMVPETSGRKPGRVVDVEPASATRSTVATATGNSRKNSPTLAVSRSLIPPASPHPTTVTSPSAVSSHSGRRKLNNAPLPAPASVAAGPTSSSLSSRGRSPSVSELTSSFCVGPLASDEALRAAIALRLAKRPEIQKRVLQIWDAGSRPWVDDRSFSRKLRSSRSVPCLITYRRKLKQRELLGRQAAVQPHASSRTRRTRLRGASPKHQQSGSQGVGLEDKGNILPGGIPACLPNSITKVKVPLQLPLVPKQSVSGAAFSGSSSRSLLSMQSVPLDTGRHISAFYLFESDFVLRAVIQKITPTDNERHIKRVTVNALAALLKNWRGDMIRLCVAGSTAYDVDSTASDLDVVLMTYQADHRKVLEDLSDMITKAQQQLMRCGMSNSGPSGPASVAVTGYDWPLRSVKMQLVHNARVPILLLKCPQGVVCDISVNTDNSISHTKFFKAILKGKPHLRALMRLVKYWVKVRRMPAMRDGGLPSIVWMLLCVFASRHSDICYSCLGMSLVHRQRTDDATSNDNETKTPSEQQDTGDDRERLIKRFASQFTHWMWSLQLSIAEANAVSPYTVLLAEFFSRLGSRQALTCTVSVAAGLCIPKNAHDVAQRVLSPPWHGGVWDELLSVEDPANFDHTFFPEALLAPPSAMLSRALAGPNICPNGIPTPMFHDLAARISSATWLVYQYELRRADMLMETLTRDFEAFRQQFVLQPGDRIIPFLKSHLQRFVRLFVALFAENAEERYRVPAFVPGATNGIGNPDNLPSGPPLGSPTGSPVSSDKSGTRTLNPYNVALVLLEGKLMLLHLVQVCADRDGWWSTEFLTRRDIRSVLHGKPLFAVSLVSDETVPADSNARGSGDAKRWILCSFNLYRQLLEQQTNEESQKQDLVSFQGVDDADPQILFNPCNLVCFIRGIPLEPLEDGEQSSLDRVYALSSEEIKYVEMFTQFAMEAPYWYANATEALARQGGGKSDAAPREPIQPAARMCKHCGTKGLVEFQPDVGYPHQPLLLNWNEQPGSHPSCKEEQVNAAVSTDATVVGTSVGSPYAQLLNRFIRSTPLPPSDTADEGTGLETELDAKVATLRTLAHHEFDHVFSRLSPYTLNEARASPLSTELSPSAEVFNSLSSPAVPQHTRAHSNAVKAPPEHAERNGSHGVQNTGCGVQAMSPVLDPRSAYLRERQSAQRQPRVASRSDSRPSVRSHDRFYEREHGGVTVPARQRYGVSRPASTVQSEPVASNQRPYSSGTPTLSPYFVQRDTPLDAQSVPNSPPLSRRRQVGLENVNRASAIPDEAGHQFVPANSEASGDMRRSDHDNRRLRQHSFNYWRPKAVDAVGGGLPQHDAPLQRQEQYRQQQQQQHCVVMSPPGKDKACSKEHHVPHSDGTVSPPTPRGEHELLPLTKGRASDGATKSANAVDNGPCRVELGHDYQDTNDPMNCYSAASPTIAPGVGNVPWKVIPDQPLTPRSLQSWNQYLLATIPPPPPVASPPYTRQHSQSVRHVHSTSHIPPAGDYHSVQYISASGTPVYAPPLDHIRSTSSPRVGAVTAQPKETSLSLPSSPLSYPSVLASQHSAAAVSSVPSSASEVGDHFRHDNNLHNRYWTQKGPYSLSSDSTCQLDSRSVADSYMFSSDLQSQPSTQHILIPPQSPVSRTSHDSTKSLPTQPSVESSTPSQCYFTLVFAPQHGQTSSPLVVSQGHPVYLLNSSELHSNVAPIVTGCPVVLSHPLPVVWGTAAPPPPPPPPPPSHPATPMENVQQFAVPGSEGAPAMPSSVQSLAASSCVPPSSGAWTPPGGSRLDGHRSTESCPVAQQLNSLVSVDGSSARFSRTARGPVDHTQTETFSSHSHPEVRTLSTDAFETASSAGTVSHAESRGSPVPRTVPQSSTVWETPSSTLLETSVDILETPQADETTCAALDMVGGSSFTRGEAGDVPPSVTSAVVASSSAVLSRLRDSTSRMSSMEENSGSRMVQEGTDHSFGHSSARSQDARRVPNKYRSDLPRYKPPSQRSNESLQDSGLKRQLSVSSQCPLNDDSHDGTVDELTGCTEVPVTNRRSVGGLEKLYATTSSSAAHFDAADAAQGGCTHSSRPTESSDSYCKRSSYPSAVPLTDELPRAAQPDARGSSGSAVYLALQSTSLSTSQLCPIRRTAPAAGGEAKHSTRRGTSDPVCNSSTGGADFPPASQPGGAAQRRSVEHGGLGTKPKRNDASGVSKHSPNEGELEGDGKGTTVDDLHSRTYPCATSREKSKTKKRQQKLVFHDTASQAELLKKDDDGEDGTGGAGAASSTFGPHATTSSRSCGDTGQHPSQSATSQQRAPRSSNSSRTSNCTSGASNRESSCSVQNSDESRRSCTSVASVSVPQEHGLRPFGRTGPQRVRKQSTVLGIGVRQSQPKRIQVFS